MGGADDERGGWRDVLGPSAVHAVNAALTEAAVQSWMESGTLACAAYQGRVDRALRHRVLVNVKSLGECLKALPELRGVALGKRDFNMSLLAHMQDEGVEYERAMKITVKATRKQKNGCVLVLSKGVPLRAAAVAAALQLQEEARDVGGRSLERSGLGLGPCSLQESATPAEALGTQPPAIDFPWPPEALADVDALALGGPQAIFGLELEAAQEFEMEAEMAEVHYPPSNLDLEDVLAASLNLDEPIDLLVGELGASMGTAPDAEPIAPSGYLGGPPRPEEIELEAATASFLSPSYNLDMEVDVATYLTLDEPMNFCDSGASSGPAPDAEPPAPVVCICYGVGSGKLGLHLVRRLRDCGLTCGEPRRMSTSRKPFGGDNSDDSDVVPELIGDSSEDDSSESEQDTPRTWEPRPYATSLTSPPPRKHHKRKKLSNFEMKQQLKRFFLEAAGVLWCMDPRVTVPAESLQAATIDIVTSFNIWYGHEALEANGKQLGTIAKGLGLWRKGQTRPNAALSTSKRANGWWGVRIERQALRTPEAHWWSDHESWEIDVYR